MTSDLGPAGVWIAILAMALVTYAVRAGGVLLMGYSPLTTRVRAFRQALPGAVVVAIIVPIAVHGGAAAAAAVIVALIVMAWRKNDLVAVVCGVAVAAAMRAI